MMVTGHNSVHALPDVPTMRLLISEFIVFLSASGAAVGTLRLRRYWLTHLGRRHDLLAATADDLAGWLANPAWKPETRKSARASARSFYRWAMDTGRVASDPTAKLPRIHVPRPVPKPAPDRVYSDALHRADRDDALMLRLGRDAGLRRAEIARVHTADVESGPSLRVTGKGGKVRLVPLTGQLAGMLDARPAGYVFPGHVDGHISPDWVGKRIARLLGHGWTAHTLRHRFATAAYAATHDLRAVQELLGHSSPETTTRYVLVPDDSLRTAVLAAAA